MNEFINAILPLSILGLSAAGILYIAAKKFSVYEDPRIEKLVEILPSANCGACGFPGCHNFSEALVKADKLSDLYCPVGGNETMQIAAGILGLDVELKEAFIAVIRCSGSPEHRVKTNTYDGSLSCRVSASLYSGDTDCSYGCLGLGDCEQACEFDALYINKKTMLPEVSEENCTACNACVVVCPKDIIELRPKGKISKQYLNKGKRIFVSCINQDKGGIAKNACSVACIACKKCQKVCDKFNAITIEDNLAYIDYNLCKLCRKCVAVCPTNSIHELNFPPKKMKQEMSA